MLYTLIRCLQMSKRLLALRGKGFLDQHFSQDISSHFGLFDHHHLCQILRKPSPDPPCPQFLESGAHSSGWWSPWCRVVHQNQNQPQLSRYLSVKGTLLLSLKGTRYSSLQVFHLGSYQDFSEYFQASLNLWILSSGKLKCTHYLTFDLIMPDCTWFWFSWKTSHISQTK